MIRIVPQETRFADLFSQMAGNLTEGAILLRSILHDLESTPAESGVQCLKEIEHAGDELTHEIVIKLNTTFITPFDREDIYRLASALDDVLDFIYAAGERLRMYSIRSHLATAVELADVILSQCRIIAQAIDALGKDDTVLHACAEISRFEREADYLSRGAIATLFEKQRDPITLIKLKELYEVLETATDRAEDVANVLETIVLKHA